MDPSEYAKLLAARGIARPLFNEYAYPEEYERRSRSREDKESDGYWGDMEVLYLAFYAFEECVALFVEGRETYEVPETQSKLSMLDSMGRITSRVFLNGERVRPPRSGAQPAIGSWPNIPLGRAAPSPPRPKTANWLRCSSKPRSATTSSRRQARAPPPRNKNHYSTGKTWNAWTTPGRCRPVWPTTRALSATSSPAGTR